MIAMARALPATAVFMGHSEKREGIARLFLDLKECKLGVVRDVHEANRSTKVRDAGTDIRPT